MKGGDGGWESSGIHWLDILRKVLAMKIDTIYIEKFINVRCKIIFKKTNIKL